MHQVRCRRSIRNMIRFSDEDGGDVVWVHQHPCLSGYRSISYQHAALDLEALAEEKQLHVTKAKR